VRFLILFPVLLAFAFLEIFIGGARTLYAIPGISLVGIAALISLLPDYRTSNRADIPALAASLLFAAYILIRNRFSEIEYIARLQFFIMAGSLLIYLLFTLVLTRPADRKLFFGFLMILAIAQLIPAVIQFTQADSWMPLPWAQRRDHYWRASGFFISPNHFSGFLEIIALLSASLTIWGRAKVTMRILLGYTCIACITGVAISGSRGGYLSLVFGSAVLLILTLVAWRRLKRDHFIMAASISTGAALALFGGILLILFMSPTLGERVMQINDPENMRVLLWHSALQQFQLSPIWGTGGFSFLYFGRLFRDPMVQNDPIHVHDDYLQLLADYGLVGAILFVIFLFLHLRAGASSFIKLSIPSISRSADLQSDRLALNIGSLAAVADYIVHSVVDFNMQLPLNALLMACILAFLANPGSPREESSYGEPGEFFRRLLRYALPVLGLAMMIYGIPMIRGEYLAERARIALRDDHPKESLQFARAGSVITHDNPELYFYRGEAAMQLAMEARNRGLQNALSLEAVGSFSSGLKVFPYDSRLALKLAQAQAAAGDYFSAIGSVDYAEKLDPNSAFVPAYRGIVEYSFGNFEDARIAFSQAIDLGGEGAQIAQKGIDLIDQQQKKEDADQSQDASASPDATPDRDIKAVYNKSDSSSPTPPDASPSEPDSTESSSDLMHALPSATPH